MKSPIPYSWKTEWYPLLLLAVTSVLSVIFYARFPDRIASHWDFAGQVNGYSGKFFGSFGLAFILAGLYLLFMIFPYLDPRKDRYGEFIPTFRSMKNLILTVLFLIYIATGIYNLGYPVNMSLFVPLMIGGLMIAIGNMMGKLKPNWFMGIRTPWTLSSDTVWNKTHRMGGYLFALFGLIIIAAPVLGQTLGLALFIGGVLLTVAGTLVYSYLIYKQEMK